MLKNFDNLSKPEILAPAGSKEAFFAAVNYGADAVYLGLNDFNARKKAENFTLENLGYYVKYAHLCNVKVYLTLNTLIKNIELRLLEDFIKSAVNLGIDAFIVQDLGVFFLIKELFPDFEIHASTQMGICNLEGAKFCEKLGFKRVILARETTFSEIERIAKNCKIETEVFVHGALCVCMSGQCYLSSSIFAKSGNRGECLQPCRKLYSVLVNNKKVSKNYMLSTSDLCMCDYVKKLQNLNIAALKIEGRMRRGEYVAASVKLYKDLIDDKPADLNPLKKLYNRGDYTSGYMFKDNVNSLMSKEVQGHKGLLIGKVIKIEKDKILIKSNQPLSKGDGFKIFNLNSQETGNGIYGAFIKENVYSLLYKGKVSINDSVHITTDSKQIEKINQLKKSIDITAGFYAKENSPAKLKLECSDITVEVLSKENCMQAGNRPLDYETVYNLLNKIKDTPFNLNSLDFNAENAFMPLSKLNELKKAAFNLLENRILEKYGFNKKYQLNENNIELNKFKTKSAKIAITDGFVVNTELFDYIVLKPKEYNVENIEKFLNSHKQFENKYLYLPPFLEESDMILISNISGNFKGFYINNPGHLEIGFIKEKRIIIGEGFNIFNAYALNFIGQFNPEAIVLSKELNTKEINDLIDYSAVPVSALVYGETEAMQLRHCVVKNIYNNTCESCKYGDIIYEDEKKERFKVVKRKLSNCNFILLNSKKLNALKNLQMEKFGFVFDFSFDTLKDAEKVQNYYIEKFIQKTNPDFNFTGFTNGSLIKGV